MESWLRLALVSGLITFLLVRNMQVALMQAGILAALYFFVLRDGFTDNFSPYPFGDEEEEEEDDEEEDDDY